MSESVSPPAMFPHLENWQKPSAHGAWVVQYGKDACLSCHKPDSGKPDSGKPDSKEKGTAPACSSCHAIYPHAEGWVEDHGPVIQIQGKAGCATQCHGLDLKGGLSKISCNDCHTTYPHPAAWSLPEQHGKQAEGVGKELCRSCHGSDLKGGRVGVSCYPCHQQQYPHATDWEEQHGAQVLSQGTTSCQTGCHGLDLKGGRSGIACTSCHKIYPHEPGWKDTHPAAVGDYGKKVCQGCHGEDFKKILSGKNCFSCHQDYPHPEKGVWDAYSGGHGERVQKDHGKDTESCELCHGGDLQTMKGGQSCFSCHPSYPHKKVTTEVWKEYGGHGEFALSHSITECQLCHGANYQGGDRKNPSCYQCHVSFPHNQGWLQPPDQEQGHGIYVGLQSSTSCATARCHGEGLVWSPGTSHGPSCDGCHKTYPHIAGWKSGVVHGPTALADVSICKECHLPTLDFASPGFQTCKECHPSYLQHKTAGIEGPGWGTEGGHPQWIPINPVTKKREIGECQLCHGANYQGGLSKQSCQQSSCHESYPHQALTDGTKWLGDAKQPQGHGKYLPLTGDGKKKDASQCQGCHGVDYNTSVGGNSCKGCHANYPHTPNWGDPTQHGVFVLKDLKKDKPESGKSSCQQCHGDNLQGGITGKSCFGGACHQAAIAHTDSSWQQDLSQHGNYLLNTLGGNKGSCQICHATGDDWSTGGISGKSCQEGACHTVYPHVGNAGVPWLDQPDKSQGHGNYLLEKPADQKQKLAGCQSCHGVNYDKPINGKSCRTCHNSYPHTLAINNLKWFENAVQPQGHGQYLPLTPDGKKKDASQCQACHGVNYDTVINGQSCKICHPKYPHDTGWEQPAGHGAYVLDNFLWKDKTACKDCHTTGDDWSTGGLSGKSCQSAACHPTFPHGADWKTPPKHGVYVIKDPNKSLLCSKCHPGPKNITCAGSEGCHTTSMKHIEGWGNPVQHGMNVLKDLKNDKTSCKVCHGDQLNGGAAQKSCFGGGCHEGTITHSDQNWKQPSQHGQYLLVNLGNNKAVCQQCHTTGGDWSTGGVSGKSCQSAECHAAYPHTDGTKAKWLDQPSKPQGHGNYLLENPADQKQKLAGCQDCHGANYDKLINGKSCRTCHNSYPHTLAINNLKWFVNAVQPQGHGQYLPLTPDGKKKDASQCQACHGANYDTLINGQSCKTCHSNYPHSVVGWEQPTQHGSYVLTTLQKDKSSCQGCHGNDLKGGITGKNCYQAGCHTNFTHQDNQWKEPSQHGLYVIQNLGKNVSSCKVCHGVAFNQMPQGKNCYDCHANYPHKEFKVDWSQAPHGQVALTKEGRDQCKKCHGNTLSGGDTNVSCKKCHTNFPHEAGWTQTTSEEVDPCAADGEPECWQTITHISPHADQFLSQKASGFPQNSSACATCHGQNYQGGNSKVACGPSCHDKNIPSHVNYPHTVVSNWNPDGQPNPNTLLNAEHGKAYLAGKPGTESSCHLCHTNLGSGPDSQSPSCNGCHKTYPHGEGWAKGATHGYKLHKNNKMAECKSCHGMGLDQNSIPGGKTCKECHAAYTLHGMVTGTSNWGDPPLEGNHGSYYLGPSGGQAACEMCHGHSKLSVAFSETDTKGYLSNKSDCYMCHWTYPHTSYEQAGWEPVVTNQCGPPKATNFAHIMFVIYSPLVATAAGEKPILGVTPLNSPLWGAAIGNTCGGGTGGSCHFDGYRSYSSKDTNGPCGSYCHGPTKPPVPKLPDCPPTPPVDPCKNDPALCEE